MKRRNKPRMLRDNPRDPRTHYTVTAVIGDIYTSTYVRVTRDRAGRPVSSLYHREDIPRWMWDAMNLLDFAGMGNTVPGVGLKFIALTEKRPTYVFSKQHVGYPTN